MSEEEQKYFKGLIGFTFDSDDIRYIEKIVDKKDKEIERLKEELEFEKATNKELLSTGADLENKLYEEQDKNKRLNNIINELENYIRARVDDDNTCSICSVMIDDLLNILEGSDKE